MSLVLIPVKMTARRANGNAVQGATVRAVLTVSESDDGLVVPGSVTGTTDSSGQVTLNLWPNSRGVNGSQYRVEITASDLYFSGLVTIPEAPSTSWPIALETLINQPPYPSKSAAEAAQGKAQEFMLSAKGYRDEMAPLVPVVQAARDEAVPAATAATAAKVAAEAARDSVNTTGKVFTSAEGTAAGIAATTNGQQFAVLAVDLQSWTVYRNNAGAALTLSQGYTKAYIDAFTATMTTVVQTVGRPVDPVDGSLVSAQGVFIWADPVASGGTLSSLKVFFKATGTFKIATFTKAGTTMTRTREASFTITSTGLKTLTPADFGVFPVAAGEYLGLSASASFSFASGTTADGAGWYQGSYGATVTVAASPNTASRLEAQFAVSQQLVTAAKVAAMQVSIDANTVSTTANAAGVNKLFSDTAQVIGRPLSATLVDGSAISNQTYVADAPISVDGKLASFSFYAKATGVVTIHRFNGRVGNNLTKVEQRTATIAATGVVTLMAGVDFTDLNLSVGDYLGVSGTGIVAYISGVGTQGQDSGYLFGNSTGGLFTAQTGYQFQTRYSVRGQVATGSAVQTLQSQVAALNVGAQFNVLNLSNVDKIVVTSNSFNEAAATLLGKSPVAIASSLSEFNWGNYSAGGKTATDLATMMAGTGALYGASYAGLKPRYTLFCEHQNSKNPAGANMTDAAYYAAVQQVMDVARANGSTPILMSEWGMGITNGYVYTVDGEQRNVRGLRALADANGSPFIDGTSKNRTVNPSMYGPFFKSNHPGTRASYIVIDALRKTAQALPRPLRSMKLFRVRGTVTVASVADLVFRTVQERHRKFREIYTGQMALSETEKVNYDVATALYASSQTQNDEYVRLNGGTAVAFGDYALIDCVLPVTGATGVSLTVSDTAATVYARKMTSTGVSWVALSLANGAFAVPDSTGLVDRDRVAFLVYKAGGLSLSASPSVAWTGGTARQVTQPNPTFPPRGAELLAQPLTVVASAIPVQWANAGALVPATLGDGAQYLPGGNQGTPLTTGAVEVTSTAGLSQAISYAQSDDSQEVVIRVWARRWVAPFNPAGDFTTAPVTYETCDTGTLQVTICGATGIDKASATLKEQVGLHWTEVEFRETLPAGTTATTIDVRSADVNLQIAKVSVRAA